MRMTINIDCSPEEARRFLGLPDISPINDMIVEEMGRQAKENISTLGDPERFVSQWFAAGGKSLEQFQQMMAKAMETGTKK